MQLAADDLVCVSCHGFVHPFLDACPGCGAIRESRLAAALDQGSLGGRALVDAEATHRVVHSVALRYTLKARSEQPTDILPDAFAIVAGSLSYRAAAAADGPTGLLPNGPGSADAVAVSLADGSLAVAARPSGRALATLPLEAIVAATPVAKGRPGLSAWAGLRRGGLHVLPQRPIAEGDLLITFAARDAAGQVALASRRGLLADRPRSDHYPIVARWLGMLATAAAEARWVEVGPAAYLAELGLDATSTRTDGVAASGGPAAPMSGAESQPGVRTALEQLEELRAAGLVSETEYTAKRSEILARL